MKGGGGGIGGGGERRRQRGQKPTFLVCYLCGQQFGTRSLSIHRPQCYAKKTIEWERGEPGKRGPKPRDPAAVDGPSAAAAATGAERSREEFNDEQFSDFAESLAPCHNCGRRFLPDRLEVHLRSCRAGSAGASKPVKGKTFSPGGDGPRPSASSSSSSPPRVSSASSPGSRGRGGGRRRKGQKPALLVCYLCGRQFGTSSLSIHRPQCYIKKMNEWERAEPGKRGPEPRDPAAVDAAAAAAAAAAGTKSREEFNDEQLSDFAESMARCRNCGRTFLADRLEVHLRSCGAGSSGARRSR